MSIYRTLCVLVLNPSLSSLPYIYLKVAQICRQGWVGVTKSTILFNHTGPPLQEQGIPHMAAPQSIHHNKEFRSNTQE